MWGGVGQGILLNHVGGWGPRDQASEKTATRMRLFLMGAEAGGSPGPSHPTPTQMKMMKKVVVVVERAPSPRCDSGPPHLPFSIAVSHLFIAFRV